MTEVTRLTESKEGGWQVLTFTVRFRNLSDQELVLAHTDRSAVAVDDLGNRYGSINNDYVKGMGISRYGRLDPSFRLRPSEARDATFRLHFRPGRQVVGTRYTFDFAVEEIEVLPRDQYRSTRQFALGFPDLTPGTDSLEEAVRQALPTCGFPGCPFGDRVRRNHRELRGRACRSAVAQCRHGRVAAAGALQADSPGRK